MHRPLAITLVLGMALVASQAAVEPARAAGGEKPRTVEYPEYPPAPKRQTPEEAAAKSVGCVTCHTSTDRASMHITESVDLGCIDCHGGDATASLPEGASHDAPQYAETKARAHVPPLYPETWGLTDDHGEGHDDGAKHGRRQRTYTLLNKESREFVRFVNPGDLRVADQACGACHAEYIGKVQRSLMSNAAMFWTGAGYNNGIVPYKRSFLGESYTVDGQPAQLRIAAGQKLTPEQVKKGQISTILPLPRWEVLPPADNFRVFERGGRFIGNLFPEIGLPNLFPGIDDPGKPDVRQSNRGLGTGARISVPVLNIHKTRLNDPFLWFMGTNDNPGDFRSSGCSACHVVYANDRDPLHSGVYAPFGHWGQSASADPTIKARHEKDGSPERGHPIRHQFNKAIPTSTCMTCHMHQPNMFVNSYLGYTMWDYESDAPLMWPEKQQYPDMAETHEILERNPEEAAIRGKWADVEFLSRVWDDVNPKAKDTQFADYHGHGWNFRAVHKRDRKGALLDADGRKIPDDLPPEKKWKRAVHMKDIHAERGMQCADCHFSSDAHGNGLMYGEVAAGVEIRCRDCHGTVRERATLRTTGPAAPPGGNNLAAMRNEDGDFRFEWDGDELYQRLIMPPHEARKVVQVVDTVTPGHPRYNEKAARAKTTKKDAGGSWGPVTAGASLAHDDTKMACFSCHSSWVTSCGGCHLPIQANWKTERHHFEGGETRNFATYNPQVAREAMFQLGVHGEVKDGIVAPVRSSSALVLSSTDINRNRIYVQQPPVSASGFSAQAFAPHFPHTVRTSETKGCTDCHVSSAGDNNAIMAQLLLLGTNFVNFLGFNAYVGEEHAVTAVQVTEWDEPQAVIGSYLHRHAYPDWYAQHQQRGRKLTTLAPGTLDGDPGWVAGLRRFLQGSFGGRALYDGTYGHHAGRVGCLQLRGEYLYTAEGGKGMRAYDVQAIGNKGFSERIVTAPFSPLGQDTHVRTENATCVALPTTQPVRPERNRAMQAERIEHESLEQKSLLEVNVEQKIHPIYSYAAITDAEEGLILVDVETLGNFEPRDNFLGRAITWNPDGLLTGARYATFAGHILYVSAEQGIVVVDLDQPLEPKVLSVIPLRDPRGTMLQFRYLFATDAEGLKVVDVTDPARPRIVSGARIAMNDARRVFVARTYAYVAAGSDGLVIVDVEKPEKPRVYAQFDAGGTLNDARDVVVATTNASLFAYVADGKNGLKVVQLTSPESQPGFYGFSPAPKPELIAWRNTASPALSLSRPLERDRAVDETGHQVAVFGRVGSRPFTLEEMQKLYLDEGRRVWSVDAQGEVRSASQAAAAGSGIAAPLGIDEAFGDQSFRADEAGRATAAAR